MNRETKISPHSSPSRVRLHYNPVNLLSSRIPYSGNDGARARFRNGEIFDINTKTGREQLVTELEEQKNAKKINSTSSSNKEEVCLICHEEIPKFSRVVPCNTCNELCHYRCWSLWHIGYTAGDPTRSGTCVHCKTKYDQEKCSLNSRSITILTEKHEKESQDIITARSL